MRYLLGIAILAWCSGVALGGGPCSGVRGGCGRSAYRTSVSIPTYDASPSSPATSSCGAVNVRAYTRKDGTHVRAHTRSAPGCGGSKPSYRTSARTKARTGYWNGTGSAPDDDESDPSLYAPPAADAPPASLPAANVSTVTSPEPLPARYNVFFKSGRLRTIADYLEELEHYLLIGTERSRGRFPKAMIDRIEPIAGAPDLPNKEHPLRQWTDKSGSHHADARFGGLQNGRIRLLKRDGKTSLVAFDELGDADQSYVLAIIAEDEGN